MNISKHFDKNNLHHAYLIEGMHEEIIPEILKFINEIKIDTVGNPDFSNISYDSFKIEDARNLKINSSEKGFSSQKKIYIISANNFLLEAQNTLLKMFEEPIENTHFFIVVPDVDILLKTLISRFYVIKSKANIEEELKNAEIFLHMSIKDRITFIKDLLVDDYDDENPLVNTNTSKSRALKFLNALEFSLEKKVSKTIFENNDFFHHIFKVREFLRQPGSSQKSLMESVALSIPIF